MKITLIKPLEGCETGAVIAVLDEMGKRLIRDGIAVKYGTVVKPVEKLEPLKPGPTKTKPARGRKRK